MRGGGRGGNLGVGRGTLVGYLDEEDGAEDIAERKEVEKEKRGNEGKGIEGGERGKEEQGEEPVEDDRDGDDVEEEEKVHVTEGEGKIDEEGKEKEPLEGGVGVRL